MQNIVNLYFCKIVNSAKQKWRHFERPKFKNTQRQFCLPVVYLLEQKFWLIHNSSKFFVFELTRYFEIDDKTIDEKQTLLRNWPFALQGGRQLWVSGHNLLKFRLCKRPTNKKGLVFFLNSCVNILKAVGIMLTKLLTKNKPFSVVGLLHNGNFEEDVSWRSHHVWRRLHFQIAFSRQTHKEATTNGQ